MIKIKWIITDDLCNISLKEFDDEWNGMVYGYFELTVNGVKEGFCPDREISKEEDGMEDILYWLSHLSDGFNSVKKGEEYEMILLTMNVYKLVIKMNEKIEMQFINKKTNAIKWKEKVELQEFENELYENIEKFLKFIEEINPELLKSKWIKKLI